MLDARTNNNKVHSNISFDGFYESHLSLPIYVLIVYGLITPAGAKNNLVTFYFYSDPMTAGMGSSPTVTRSVYVEEMDGLWVKFILNEQVTC